MTTAIIDSTNLVKNTAAFIEAFIYKFQSILDIVQAFPLVVLIVLGRRKLFVVLSTFYDTLYIFLNRYNFAKDYESPP